MKKFAAAGMALSFGVVVALTFQVLGWPVREYLVLGLVTAGSFLLGMGVEKSARN